MLLKEIVQVDLLPSEAAKTAPKPMANGPPMLRNFSLGAQTATVESPPTIPAVYLVELRHFTNIFQYDAEKKTYIAARRSMGPPRKHIGAITAPITAE